MKTILITGGTGFVGSYLHKLLRERKPEAHLVLTSLERQLPPDDQTEIAVCDLSDQQSVEILIQQTQPDEVYHLASIAHVAAGFERPAEVLTNNFQLTLSLLEAVRLHHPSSRILLVSSADLYDHHDPSPIDEKRLVRPLNPYAVSKAAQDMLGQAYAASFDIPIIIVRPFNHIGPGQRRGFVVADFASMIAAAELDPAKTTLRVGNLESERDFTDVRDMVAAYQLLMERGTPGEIYNAGTGVPVRIQDLLDQLVALSTVEVKVETDPAKFRPVDYPQVLCDASKLRSLGWQPQISLSETLKDILDSWRDIVRQEKKDKV